MKRRALLATVLTLCAAAPGASAALWPTDTDRIAHQLESPDATERRAAVLRFRSFPSQIAAPLITRALGDDDLEVRLAAAQAALSLSLVEARPLVVPWLNEPDARVRLAACQVLRVAPPEAAIVPLARVLGDADFRVRQASAQALGNSSSPDAVIALLGHLDDSTPEVRVAVVDALFRLGDARAVIPLGGKIADSAPEVRRAVARALGELGDRRASSSLILALRDASRDVRIEALLALGSLGDEGAVLAIVPHTSTSSGADVRRAALSALGKIGGEKSLSALIASLEQDDPTTARAPARDAIVSMGTAAVPKLLATLAAPPSETSAALSAQALGAIHASEAREPIIRALQKGVLAKIPALRALASLGDPAALSVALELLSDRSPGVRADARATAFALMSSSTPQGQAVDPIVAALDDPHATTEERGALARLLGRTRAPRAAAKLAGLASSQTLSIKLAGIEALGNLGPTGDDAAILGALDDENPVVRARAGAALALCAKDAVVGKLLERIDSSAEQDRPAIATALAGALARATSPAVLSRAAALLATTDGRMRDAIAEGLGRSSQASAIAEVAKLASSLYSADRRKAAESLAGQESAATTLRSLLSDYDAGVRANAAWSLSATGDATDIARLAPLLNDGSSAVSANAAVSIGRLAARTKHAEDARAALCGALADGRSYVRADALAGLSAAGIRCGDDGSPERLLLASDVSPTARAAAADLLARVASKLPERDLRALSRCRREDPYGSVAQRCKTAAAVASSFDPVDVVVVAEGQSTPDSEAPFALVFADGSIRHGVADRRGAIFERVAPHGTISLDVPAPFSR